MKKYLVIADTYAFGYGVDYHLFTICDSKEEAIKFIFDNPVHQIGERSFDFFSDYKRFRVIGKRILSKEEYITTMFIKEFSGNPMFIGGYIE